MTQHDQQAAQAMQVAQAKQAADVQNIISKLEGQILNENIAKDMDPKYLEEIGQEVHQGYLTDEESRSDYMEKYDDYINLATQVSESKNWPWEQASNVKYPLLSIASLQYASRAYAALIPRKKVVKGKVIGYDPDGKKLAAADRVSRYMSYHFLEEMEDWEDEMDRLCLLLPIVGNAFKKTYYDG